MNGETSLAAYANSLLEKGVEVELTSISEDNNKQVIQNCVTSTVYDLLTLSDRRKHGIFFSGQAWAETLIAQLEVNHWKRFLDPSVGSGDLLVEICKKLPLAASPSATLANWSSRLAAIDLRESFLQIAWARIQAVAISRHRKMGWNEGIAPSLPMPNSFRTGDALSLSLGLKAGDCVIMNPPYQLSDAPAMSFVGRGKRSAAALHLEHVINGADNGVGIVALVPEVLRSGTSYKRFRNEVSARVRVSGFNSLGSFGRSADVDVAIFFGVTQKQPPSAEVSSECTIPRPTVGDKYSIRVGPVVPHRTPIKNLEYGYLTAKNSPVWAEIIQPPETAKYSARLEQGPFVVVRRTSSPSDRKRARASLILSSERYLVENHLIIMRPLSGEIDDCRALIAVLQDARTDEWLNKNLRCRHLTVSALTSIPWWD